MSGSFRIMVRCPATGQVQETGLAVSSREALSNDIFREGMVGCRFCGRFHSLVKEVFFEAGEASFADDLWRPNPQAG